VRFPSALRPTLIVRLTSPRLGSTSCDPAMILWPLATVGYLMEFFGIEEP
jgi:hypothetical protein